MRLKIVAFAPMPSPRMIVIRITSRGFFRTCRNADFRSSVSPLIEFSVSSHHRYDHESCIVLQWLSAKRSNGFQELLLKVSGWELAVFEQQVDQPVFTEFLFPVIRRLGNSVRDQD